MRFATNPWPHSRASWLHSRQRSLAIAATALLALVAMAGLAASAQAATYTVGTPNDVAGPCEPKSGTCSLRQLIEYENTLPLQSPADGIVVPGGKYNLSHGALLIKQTLAIVGAGARTTEVDVEEGALQQRVFEVKPPNGGGEPTVVITGLEISGGTASEELNGFFGGDVYNSASLLLNEDWITAGTASSGGGISNDAGTLVLARSLVSGNHAISTSRGDSGGIQNLGSAVGCPSVCGPGKKAVLVLEDSTVTGNDARLGAGIFSSTEEGVADENQVSVINSTIAYNSTKEEPCTECFAYGPGAGLLAYEGTIDVVSSILAHNTETTPAAGTVNTNCSIRSPGTIVSLGYNLETEADCGFTATGDLQNQLANALFSSGTPQNNGGNTDTLALEPTSPAVDAIPTSWPFCTGTDQRGVTRPQGAGCDIGAFELTPFTIQATEGAKFSGQVTTSQSGGVYTSPAPTIEWGDGQTSEGTVKEGSFVLGSHTFAEEGTYTGSVTYHNDFGSGTHKVAFVTNVADAALSATGVPVSATAGAQFSGTVATFSDADPAGTASDYTATISWGDGSASAGTVAPAPGGGFAVTGSHTYANGGTYPTSIAINDAGGASATATSSANVAAVPSSPAPPTLLTPSPPSVLTTTSATFTATVNPHGLPTSVHFEYGPVLPGAKPGPIVYGSSTPNQLAGSDFANHTITATVTGLLPNVTYHVRAVATNSAGNAQGADQVMNTPADPPPPPPVLGKTANVAPVSGSSTSSCRPAQRWPRSRPRRCRRRRSRR